jgi:hypothetical protein
VAKSDRGAVSEAQENIAAPKSKGRHRGTEVFEAKHGTKQQQQTAFVIIPGEVKAGFNSTAKLAHKIYSWKMLP